MDWWSRGGCNCWGTVCWVGRHLKVSRIVIMLLLMCALGRDVQHGLVVLPGKNAWRMKWWTSNHMKQEAPFLHFARDSFSNSCTLYIYIYVTCGRKKHYDCNGTSNMCRCICEWTKQKGQRNLRFALKDSRRFFWVPAAWFFGSVPCTYFHSCVAFGCFSMLIFEDMHRCHIWLTVLLGGLE